MRLKTKFMSFFSFSAAFEANVGKRLARQFEINVMYANFHVNFKLKVQ